MLQVVLDADTEKKLNQVAIHEKLSPEFLVGEVVRHWLEDREDYAAGVEARSSMKYSISLDEMERRSDVAD